MAGIVRRCRCRLFRCIRTRDRRAHTGPGLGRGAWRGRAPRHATRVSGERAAGRGNGRGGRPDRIRGARGTAHGTRIRPVATARHARRLRDDRRNARRCIRSPRARGDSAVGASAWSRDGGSRRSVLSDSAQEDAVIAYENVTIAYDATAKPVVTCVSLRAERGAVTAIVGPNGSGKSTLVRALLGRVPLVSGRITIDGTDVGEIPRRELARRCAVVTQREDTTFARNVAEYIALGRYPRTGAWGSAAA